MIKIFAYTLLSFMALSACNNEDKTILFNSENLDNWTIVLPDSVNEDNVFRVENGNLYVSGIPNGYIRTNESYSNYKLHLEWRWVEEPKNSGVLLNIHGQDNVWPSCIEAQLKSENAGDFVMMGKGAGITVNEKLYLIEDPDTRFMRIEKIEKSSENPAGEWNSYDISVTDKSIKLVVNGVTQNFGKNPTYTEGFIGLQSEGGPMEFRNIYLTPYNLDK